MTLDLKNTHIYGQLGAIICFFLDNDNIPTSVDAEDFDDGENRPTETECRRMEEEMEIEAYEEQKRIGNIIGRLHDIANRRFQRINGDDLWDVWDALGRFPDRDDVLQDIYVSIDEELERRRTDLRKEKA